MVDGHQARPGEQQSGGGDRVEQVEFEAAPAGLAEDTDRPLDLGHDEQELDGGEGPPQPGQQTGGQADAPDELDGDRRPGQQLR